MAETGPEEILPHALYRSRYAAALLGIHPKTLIERLHDGEIRGYREGRSWRVLGRWLLDYIDERADQEQQKKKLPALDEGGEQQAAGGEEY